MPKIVFPIQFKPYKKEYLKNLHIEGYAYKKKLSDEN